MLQKASPSGAAGWTPTVDRKVTVAVVDQTPLFREGLCGRVSRDPGMRLANVTGQPVALLGDRLPVDVLVLDAMLDPRGALVRRLTGTNRGLTVVVLVREPYRTSQFLTAMLAAGVHGLVPHASSPDRILEAIRRSKAEGCYLDPTLAPLVAAEPAPRSRWPGLSNREFQVLQLIANGLSNQGVADALVLSVETVRTHIKGLLRKLDARDRAHAVARGFRLGLLGQHGDRIPSAAGRVPQARGRAEVD